MVINSDKKYKIGFSLLEAMVVMVIVAIFVAVIANSIPHKSKPKLAAETHGGYECYWKNNKLYSRAIAIGTEGSEKEESGECCNFKPNQYVNYIVFNAVGGGSRGGEDIGGGAGEFKSAFFSSPNRSYQLCPGKGGDNSNPNGYPSTVKSGSNDIVKVDGGSEATTIKNTKFSDIREVYIEKSMGPDIVHYGCLNNAIAWLDDIGQKIRISFCRTSLDIVEKTLEYSNPQYTTVEDKYKTVLQSPLFNSDYLKYDSDNNQLVYYDVGEFTDYGNDPRYNTDCTFNKISSIADPMCPSRFKLIIKINVPDYGNDGETSELTKYAQLMQYSNLAGINPGNGGAKNLQNGSSGAILVVW